MEMEDMAVFDEVLYDVDFDYVIEYEIDVAHVWSNNSISGEIGH